MDKMDKYGTFLHNRILIITQNTFLRLGLTSLLENIDLPGIKNVVFIDIGSLNFISDLGIILNSANTNGYSVILICSGGEMSMALSRFPHIDINQSLSSWREKISTLLSPNLTSYYLRDLNELLFLEKLGAARLSIILMISKGANFHDISRKLSLTHKTLYRYISGLTSYFNMKNSSFLFFFLKNRFPPAYFDSLRPEKINEYQPHP